MLSLAWHNLGRRRARTGATVLAVALATAVLFSVLAIHRGYEEGMRSELDRLGAHILVVPKGCPYDAASMALHGATWPCYLQEASLRQVRATPGVESAAPVLMNAVALPGGGQAVYLGVEPGILALKRAWRIRGRFPRQSGEALVGSEVARDHGLEPGERFGLPGLSAEATIAGILEPTGGAEDLFVHLPLADAQQIFRRPGQLTHVLVRLQNPDRLNEVVNALRGCDAGMQMNVVPLSHLFASIQQLLRSTRLLLVCVAAAALLAALAGVSNAVLLSVTERTGEIGVLRALGASVGDVVRLVWLEAALTCVVGAIAGLLLAAVGSRWTEAWVRGQLPFTPAGSLARADLAMGLACAGAAVLLGSLAGLPAAWRAGRMAPVAAIRAGQAIR